MSGARSYGAHRGYDLLEKLGDELKDQNKIFPKASARTTPKEADKSFPQAMINWLWLQSLSQLLEKSVDSWLLWILYCLMQSWRQQFNPSYSVR